jgi:hypothetical protein
VARETRLTASAALGGYHGGDPVDPTIAQVVSIIRNPLDCLLSFFSYLNSISDGHAVDRHEGAFPWPACEFARLTCACSAHVQGIVGENPTDQAQMSRLVARWVRFYNFWNTHRECLGRSVRSAEFLQPSRKCACATRTFAT